MILVFYAGGVAGIVVGLLVFQFLLVICCVGIYCYFKRNMHKVMPKFMSLSGIYVIEQKLFV